MGLKYYLNLFKKDTNNEAVKLRYFLNAFVMIVYFVLFFAFFSLRNTNIVLSSVFGVLTFVVIILYRFLTKSFERLLMRLINEEPLNQDDEIDAAFIAYRQGYIKFNEKIKKLDKKLLPLNLITTIPILLLLPTIIILDLIGSKELADKIYSFAIIFIYIYLFAIFISAIISSRKGIWYQNYRSEIAIINKFKGMDSANTIKYKFIEDKKPKEQMKYFLPNEALRKKHDSLLKTMAIVAGAVMVLGIAAIMISVILTSKMEGNEDLQGRINGYVFWVVVVFITVPLVFFDILRNRVIKSQYKELQQQDSQGLFLRLHQLRTPFIRRWNILFVVCFLGAIVSNILFAGLTTLITKSEEYGWIFFLLFVVEFIATFVVYFKALAKLRQKMMLIEDEIDRLRMQNSQQDFE